MPGAKAIAKSFDFWALLASAGLALLAPLEVFLFAYIVLGPVHYVTEIGWLHRRDYLVEDNASGVRAYLWISVAASLVCMVALIIHRGWGFWCIGGLLVGSLALATRRTWVLPAGVALLLVLHHTSPLTVFLIAVAVPTLVHVFAFTWVFLLSGVLRERGARRGWMMALPALMLLLPVLLVVVPTWPGAPNAFWLRMEQGSFLALHRVLTNSLAQWAPRLAALNGYPAAESVLRVFAFAYLFHYLNWFGKTGRVGWHRASRKAWMVMGAVLAVAMGLYLWSAAAGFIVGTYLSMLHVFLEFPLNWKTIRGLVGPGPKPQPALAQSGSA